MSQFGMQMPGGRARRAASPDVYAALGFVAAAFLLVACVMMWQAGTRIGKDGSPFGLQEQGKVQLKAQGK